MNPIKLPPIETKIDDKYHYTYKTRQRRKLKDGTIKYSDVERYVVRNNPITKRSYNSYFLPLFKKLTYEQQISVIENMETLVG